jgi:hypothetical protein
MTRFMMAARKAVATFIFAAGGVLLGEPLLDYSIATWKVAASVGLGALLNLVYRWSEATLKEGDG